MKRHLEHCTQYVCARSASVCRRKTAIRRRGNIEHLDKLSYRHDPRQQLLQQFIRSRHDKDTFSDCDFNKLSGA